MFTYKTHICYTLIPGTWIIFGVTLDDPCGGIRHTPADTYGTACIRCCQRHARIGSHTRAVVSAGQHVQYRSPQCKNRREVGVFNMQNMCCTLIPGIWGFTYGPRRSLNRGYMGNTGHARGIM